MSTVADRDAWLAWRLAGITASDVARAATGKYGGAYTVLAEKQGLLPPVEETSEMRRGLDLEPTLAAMVQLATGWYVVGEQTLCQADHMNRPDWRCTVDGFAADQPDQPYVDCPAGVELKTHGREVRPAFDYYRTQVQWQMLVTGFERWVLAVAEVDDSTMRIGRFTVDIVEADELTQMALIDVAEDLGAHLAAGTLPDPDGSDHSTDAVRAVTYVQVPNADLVDLTDMVDLLDRRAQLKPAMAAAKDELAEIDNRIRNRLGQAGHGTAPGWKAAYSKPRGVFDETAAMEAHPEFTTTTFDRTAAETALGKKALEQYRVPIGARVLTITPTKEHNT